MQNCRIKFVRLACLFDYIWLLWGIFCSTWSIRRFCNLMLLKSTNFLQVLAWYKSIRWVWLNIIKPLLWTIKAAIKFPKKNFPNQTWSNRVQKQKCHPLCYHSIYENQFMKRLDSWLTSWITESSFYGLHVNSSTANRYTSQLVN